MSNKKKCELVGIEILKKNPIELSLTYEITNIETGSVDELKIPRVQLPINPNWIPTASDSFNSIDHKTTECGLHYVLSISPVNYDFGGYLPLVVIPDRERDGMLWERKCIKSADPIELTIEEIEKMVGRPVQIVKKKEDTKE